MGYLLFPQCLTRGKSSQVRRDEGHNGRLFNLSISIPLTSIRDVYNCISTLQATSAWEALESMGVRRDLIMARSERWGLTEDTTAWNPHHWDRYSFRSRAEARASNPQTSVPCKPKGKSPSQSRKRSSSSRIDLMAAAAGRLTSLAPLLEKVVQQEEQGEGSNKRFKRD